MANFIQNEPIPLQDAIARPPRQEFLERRQADPLAGLITTVWQDWFTNLLKIVGAVPSRIRSVSVPAGTAASIAATDMAGGALGAGLYRFSWAARLTQAASTSSSLAVTLTFNDGGVAQTYSWAAYTGNAVNAPQTGTILFRTDGAPINYATTYASVGGTPMQYQGDFILEQVSV